MENITGNPRSLVSLLILGSRPRTLPAAIVPVCIGAASIEDLDVSMWWKIGLAAIVSLALQIAVNYANDYSDGVKGTDDVRVGPLRLVGSGLVPAVTVKRAAIVMLGIAAVAGLVLALVSSLWILLIGVCAMVAAWTYTGGPRPYGYAGLGEVFVFVFFGVVATVGTQFVVSESMTALSYVASIAVGAIACALLVVNNLRDLEGDADVGKRTLAVKLGDRTTRYFFVALFAVAAIAVVVVATMSRAWALLGLFGLVPSIPALRSVVQGASKKELISVLGIVGRTQLVFGVLFSVGIYASV
jgi:1,4-dihydroxy-2-naphthoate octaprenyltransferase